MLLPWDSASTLAQLAHFAGDWMDTTAATIRTNPGVSRLLRHGPKAAADLPTNVPSKIEGSALHDTPTNEPQVDMAG